MNQDRSLATVCGSLSHSSPRRLKRLAFGAAGALALTAVAVVGSASVSQAASVKPTVRRAALATAVASPGISAPPDVIVGEADGHVDLPVTLSAPGMSAVSVAYTTADSSAFSGTTCGDYGNSYVSVKGTLNFPAGVTTKIVRVDLLDCGVSFPKNGFRSFTLNLSSPVNATITRASTRVGIVGDGNVSTSPGLYVRDAVVDNRSGTVDVPVMLGGPAGTRSASTVTVAYATHNATAVAGTDYTATSGTLTFGPGQTAKNVVVPITDRSGAAPARRFSVSLSSPVNATIVDGTGVVTIGASGAPAVSSPGISAPPDVIVGEADGYIDLPVSLSAPGTSTVSVTYTTANSTATSGTTCGDYGNSYVSVKGTLNFPAGVTTKIVRVDLLDCGVSFPKNGFRSFTLNLSSPVNATITRASTRVGIVGDGNVSTSPGLYVRDAVVDNRSGTVDVPVMLGGPAGTRSASTVTVAYATHNATAIAGTDYTATSGTLTFGPGQTAKNVVVPITDRSGAAPARRFSVSLSSPVNATIVDGTGVVTIGASGAPAVSSPGISAPPDVIVGEADGYIDLPVSLSAPGTSAVSVTYTTTNSTATSGTTCGDYGNSYVSVSGTLNFPAGATTEVVRVDLLDCGVSFPKNGFRSFTLNLSSPVNATITRASTRVGIVGDGNVSTSPGLYVRDAVVDNRSGTVDVPVMLGGPAGTRSASTVTVAYATHNATAVAGTDYTATSGTLTFGPGQTAKNVVVPITDRSGAAPARRFSVSLSSPVNATIVDGTGVVTIGASGAPAVSSPGISAPPDVIVGEADGYIDLPVSLSAPGTSTVSVTYTTANSTATSGTTCGDYGNSYVSVSGTLNFPAGVTTKIVRVDLLDCSLANPGYFTLNLSSPVNATITRASTRITIVKNPGAPGAPTGVSAVAGNRMAVVTFAAPASDGGNPVNSYTVTASPGGAKASSVTSPITVTGLTNGTAYSFTVTASNDVATGPASAPSNTVIPSTVPSAPTAVRAVSGSTTAATGSLTVTFTLGADNGSAITSQTAKCASSNGGATETGTHTGASAAPITVESLTTGKTYTCTVTATNARGASLASAPSLPVTVGAPAAPTGVTATRVAAGQLRVTFTPGVNNGSTTTGYTASCASTNGGTDGSATGSASPITVSGLTAGKSYSCAVTATNARGTSPRSNASSPVTA